MSALLSRWREVLVGVVLAVVGWETARLLPASWYLVFEGALVAAAWLLTLALVLHAGWDLAHHDGRISKAVPRWYPSFCAAADLVLAGLFWATRPTGG